MLQLLINKKPLNFAMAPKKQAASKSSARGTAAKKSITKGSNSPKSSAKTASDDDIQDPKSTQQNLLNNLKSAKKRIEDGRPQPGDESKLELLHKYQSLDRYSSEKKDLLERWNKDRSVGWWRTYEDSKGSEYKETEEGMKGYGSRHVNCIDIYYIIFMNRS